MERSHLLIKIKVGCAGWSYTDWIGVFYPKNLNQEDFLKFYALYFDIVEINSTFYNLPTSTTIIKWLNEVPQTFQFIVKVWQEITHLKNYVMNEIIEDKKEEFFQRMDYLKEKISHFLYQFPPYFKYSEKNLQFLKKLVKTNVLNTEIKYVIELRDNSWFEPSALLSLSQNLLNKNNIILCTNYIDELKPVYLNSQQSYYIRLIKNRELRKFNRIQRPNYSEWADLLSAINNLQRKPDISDIFIIFNNHFSGFSPQDVNILKKKLNLPFKELKQKNITDFF